MLFSINNEWLILLISSIMCFCIYQALGQELIYALS